RAFKKGEVCVEVNTAGLRHPVQEIYPTEEFLALCRAHRVPVCLGSDAHRPADVGAGLEQAVALLREVGYREIALFRRRRRILREL
ncbi:MAG: histidinol-phosphatase, partial [Firmicutes bacterium]|nr:histidinol-phosphatase [Bacillota bacterium]